MKHVIIYFPDNLLVEGRATDLDGRDCRRVGLAEVFDVTPRFGG